ncbi:MAG: hypothetical protein ABJZ55_26160 [Fuerstiella sp.]
MTDAINTSGARHFRYSRWITRLIQTDEAPTLPVPVTEIVTDFRAERVIQSAGSSTLDSAQLNWNVSAPLINRVQATNFAWCVEVFLPNATSRLHLGDYVTETEAVNSGGEFLTAQSHLRKWHFGTAWIGQVWWDARTNAEVAVSEPPSFNPLIDGKILGNRSNRRRLDTNEAFIWCHPEQLLTKEAQTYSGQTAQKWTLRQAVAAMCWEMNNSEKFIDNPNATSLAKLDDAPVLEDVRLSMDVSLPVALDRLLHPLGFNWHIDYDLPKCRIELFEVGKGMERELLFQAPREVLDLAKSNVNDYRIARQIGDAPNAVYALGDFERREITLPLFRGWQEADDSLSAADLKKSDTASQYKDKPLVWRQWVANEAGDYNGTRAEITDPPDLSSVFANYVAHRREIEDPITFDGDADNKQRRQMLLEWSSDGGTTWELVPPSFGQPYVTPGQIGVLFTGDSPPSAMIDAGADAQLRITGTVQGNKRIQEYAQPTADAPNGRTNMLTLDVPSKFQSRKVQSSGPFASTLAGHEAGADEQDDETEIKEFAEKVRDQNTCAELDCRFVLPGIHTTYKIGDLITKIKGREIDLNACGGSETRYPQIIRREFSYSPSPTTILTVDRTAGRNARKVS